MLSSLVYLGFLSAAVSASRVHLEGKGVTRPVEDWRDLGAANPSQKIEVGVSMKTDPVKRQELEDFFWQVSDPKHPLYAQYKTQSDIKSLLAAKESDLTAVQAWLTEHGATATRVSNNLDYVYATLTVANAEELLETTFHNFASKKYSVEAIPRIVTPYSVPDEISSVAALIDGVRMLPGLRVATDADSSGKSPDGAATWPNFCSGASRCAGKITPNVTSQIYNSAPLTDNFKVAAGNGMAVAEFQGQQYTLKDLETFSAGCNIPTVEVTDVNGNAVGRSSGVETMLDIEYISGNALGIPLSNFYYQQYSLLNWITQVNAQTGTAPLVYSVSYGNDERQQTSTEYMYQCNTGFMAAGALGFSVLFASGDQGVWGRSGFGAKFHPDFPAASPYITAVGGTDFVSKTPDLNSHEEKCSTDGGGGFSDTFAIPSYQANAVATYVKEATDAGTIPAQKFWNATGRAYPDISASFGAVIPYCVLANSVWEGVGGTSASCPTVAHGIAILNNMQLTAGKKPLGFLNPWLYVIAVNGDAYTDILTGMNNQNIGQGFTAAPGWDPCSGNGTPDFAAMAKYLP